MEASPSDVALLAAVGQRDLDAMRALYDRHAAWLVVLAMASIAIFFVCARHLRELRPRRNWS